jgi:hypothetical protein
VALDACICIGKLGIKDCEIAVERMSELYEDFEDWNKKAVCLETLVKLFDCTSTTVIKFIIHQIELSPYWTARSSAIKLLSFIGAPVICNHEEFSKIYELLEARLASDPVRGVRQTVGSTIKDLKIYDIFAARMIK